MNRPEETLQRSVVQYLRAAAPDLVWYAVPNQRGTRKRFEAALLKGVGVRAGVSDLALILPGGRAGFIELKAPGGRVSDHQKAFLQDAERAGAAFTVARSLEDVERFLITHQVPLRTRLGAVAKQESV